MLPAPFSACIVWFEWRQLWRPVGGICTHITLRGCVGKAAKGVRWLKLSAQGQCREQVLLPPAPPPPALPRGGGTHFLHHPWAGNFGPLAPFTALSTHPWQSYMCMWRKIPAPPLSTISQLPPLKPYNTDGKQRAGSVRQRHRTKAAGGGGSSRHRAGDLQDRVAAAGT